MKHLSLWAKSDPYHPLWCHLLDTAAVCERLIDCLGCPDDIPPAWAMYVAALHDIGKADPQFQVKDETLAERLRELGLALPEHRSEFRHEARSAEWVLGHLIAEKSWGKHAARVVSAALRGHHGNFRAEYSRDESAEHGEWEQMRGQLATGVEDVLGLKEYPFAPEMFGDASSTGVQLVGLTVLSDWIASNEELFRYPSLNANAGLAEYWEQAKREATRAADSLRLASQEEDCGDVEAPAFVDIWPDITTLRPSQRALEEACKDGIRPGLAIIEAPMGEGKTESAVYLAEYWRARCGAKGTYIALPTMATSNQMHGRYREFLSKRRPDVSAPRLVHGMAWLVDDVSPESGSKTYGDRPNEEQLLAWEWFNPSKRALIAPEGVGTIDQALMAALNVKHGFLRLLGLSSKVLIIDEVHAYDEYMTVILERLLEWCRTLRIPVVMLSATLSLRQKRRLVEAYGGSLPETSGKGEPYPLITLVALDGEPEARLVPVEAQPARTVAVHQCMGMLDDVAETAGLAVKLVRGGGCACVLVNTVKQAQAVYRALEDFLPEDERHLFHARFPAWRRGEIEEQVVGLFGKETVVRGSRPKRAVLVATQVVEQSLDLDFDVMISQLAPIDLLLQRTGRMRRHKDTPRPAGLEEALYVLMPDAQEMKLGSSEYVYGRAALLRTVRTLEGRAGFYLPEDFRPLIEACYGGEYTLSDIVSEREQTVADEKSETRRELEAGKASSCLIPPPSKRQFSIAEPSASILKDESDDATTSYFSASTRLESHTQSVLILEDPALIASAREPDAPGRRTLKALFRHKVDIPGWWLKNAEPADGFEPFFEGARWLRRTTVILTREGVWGATRGERTFDIVNDGVQGVEMRESGG